MFHFTFLILDKLRRKKVHDAFADGFYRLLVLITINGILARHMTTQLFFNVAHANCWEWHIFAVLSTMICIHSVLQVYFGIDRSCDMVLHHLVLCVALLMFVNDVDVDAIYFGYLWTVAQAYGIIFFSKYWVVMYQIHSHRGATEKAHRAFQIRTAIVVFNFVVFWTVFCGYFFYQALFVERMIENLSFIVFRLCSWVLFYMVELYIVWLHRAILAKKMNDGNM